MWSNVQSRASSMRYDAINVTSMWQFVFIDCSKMRLRTAHHFSVITAVAGLEELSNFGKNANDPLTHAPIHQPHLALLTNIIRAYS